MDPQIFWSAGDAFGVSDTPGTWDGDLSLEIPDLARDEDLKTAVLISLFSDRRALIDDVLPDGISIWRGSDGDAVPGLSGRRGWWADPTLPALPTGQADWIGSRLWLLSREKWTPAVAERVRFYAEEALTWLLEDGVATALAVEVERTPFQAIQLYVTITRSGGALWQGRFDWAWSDLFKINQ